MSEPHPIVDWLLVHSLSNYSMLGADGMHFFQTIRLLFIRLLDCLGANPSMPGVDTSNCTGAAGVFANDNFTLITGWPCLSTKRCQTYVLDS